MLNIAIIGAGQIGSRHLQSLATLEAAAVIHLVDPSGDALRVASERFAQVRVPQGSLIELQTVKHFDAVQVPLDLAIVATSANVRADIIQRLLLRQQVRHLLLEKVLFQKVADYTRIGRLLAEAHVPAWVNCGYRAAGFYKELKERFPWEQAVQLEVDGSAWGLACNTVHFLDLLAFLSSSGSFHITRANLDRTILDAKRAGFKEFTGTLEGVNGRGDTFRIACRASEATPLVLRLTCAGRRHEITNPFDLAEHSWMDAYGMHAEKQQIPYQSQRTANLVQQVLNTGSCALPAYAAAAELHLPLIQTFLAHYNAVTGLGSEACPIT